MRGPGQILVSPTLKTALIERTWLLLLAQEYIQSSTVYQVVSNVSRISRSFVPSVKKHRIIFVGFD